MEPWRLVRTRYTYWGYEALKRVGVTATRMYEYVAEGAPPACEPPPGVAVRVHNPGDPTHRDEGVISALVERARAATRAD
jgi:hypothetical protein